MAEKDTQYWETAGRIHKVRQAQVEEQAGAMEGDAGEYRTFGTPTSIAGEVRC